MKNSKNEITKIVVDRNLCIGAASCIAVAPDVFELDEENKAVIKIKNGGKKSEKAQRENLENEAVTDEILKLAAESCPTKAIFLYDEKGEQVYP